MKNLIVSLCIALSLSAAYPQQELSELLYFHPLDHPDNSVFPEMQNNGGTFLSGQGWQANNEYSQLLITLPTEGLPYEGMMVIDVTNFDPASQNVIRKQQIINMYSRRYGQNDSGELYPDMAWFSIRTGKGYTGPADGATHYKFLAHPHGRWSREETRIKKIQYWNKNHTYQFRVVWTRSRIHLYLDDVLQATFHFEGQIEPFRYIFIGKDDEYYYRAQPGPIYSNLKIYSNITGPAFSNITESSHTKGLGENGYGSSVSIADVNHDGLCDFFVGNASTSHLTTVLLYEQQSPLDFAEKGTNYGLDHRGITSSIMNADVDNDGDLDLFCAQFSANNLNFKATNRLFLKQKSGPYRLASDSLGLVSNSTNTKSALFLDVEGDGDLDLYQVNWGQANELYINEGDGSFHREIRGCEGPDENPNVFGQLGCTAADVDNDGDSDIYVCRRQEGDADAPNWLFINDGSGNFREEALERGVALGGRSHGATFADIDNDGDLDLFVVNYLITHADFPQLGVFINRGNGYFEDMTDEYHIYISGFHVLLIDIDNDADLDMLLLHNDEKEPGVRPRLYLNDGTGQFDLTFLSGVEVPGSDSRSAAYADFDADGDLDIYIACRESRSYLLRNDIVNNNHYIEILCEGAKGDYGGLGSRVSVYQAGFLDDPDYLLGYQESTAQFGYLAQNQTPLHFGLGQNTSCDMKIELTDGTVRTFRSLQADQLFIMKDYTAGYMEYLDGDQQSGYLNYPLSNPLKVRIYDSNQVPLENIAVHFSILEGEGAFNKPLPVLTDSNGIAKIHFIPENRTGSFKIQASAEVENSPVIFSGVAENMPIHWASLAELYTGIVGMPVQDDCGVQASDIFGNPVEDEEVLFTVESQFGHFVQDTFALVRTGTDGIAVMNWTLGEKSGMQICHAETEDSTLTLRAISSAANGYSMHQINPVSSPDYHQIPYTANYTVMIRDRYDNPVGGQAVSFRICGGDGHLKGEKEIIIVSDDSGFATVQWTTGPYWGPEQNLCVNALNDSGNHLQGSPQHWLFPGQRIDPDSSVIRSEGDGVANGESRVKIVVALRDSCGRNAGAGFHVDLVVYGDKYKLFFTDSLTDANGQIEACLSSTLAGEYKVIAKIRGLDVVLTDTSRIVFVADNNLPPEIRVVADTTAIIGEMFELFIETSDPENDAIALFVEGLPANAVLSARKEFWLLQWRPTLEDSGSHIARFSAVSSNGATTKTACIIQILPPNSSPKIIAFEPADTSLVAQIGDTLYFSVSAVDTDEDSVIQEYYLYEGAVGLPFDGVFIPNSNTAATIRIEVLVHDHRDTTRLTWRIHLHPAEVTADREFTTPDQFMLYQNYPNPFNPVTHITFALPNRSEVQLLIINLRGERIATLVHDVMNAGLHRFSWNTKSTSAADVSSGIYLAVLKAGGRVQTRKIILLK